MLEDGRTSLLWGDTLFGKATLPATRLHGKLIAMMIGHDYLLTAESEHQNGKATFKIPGH
ncbi:hypothetical protein PG996_010321 [Apiospora saccharicola]|uniref:Uncharacterized protein n=1 Tax=Apiospora saccharicola TaxID=335842 RepID=A0ABR1UN95_9PEZI